MNLFPILHQWFPDEVVLRKDLPVQGSPDRCHARYVVESPTDGLWLLEAVGRSKAELREQQARRLSALVQNGMQKMSPWRKAPDGSFGILDSHHYWQMRRYLKTDVSLPRETYGYDGWRGEAMAQVLLNLRQASSLLSADLRGKPFFLSEYLREALLPEIQQKNPALYRDIQPMLQELVEFFSLEASLPTAFCHGDFHPGNILWENLGIGSVIDWEFCGPKTQLYDVANLLGCLGMDEPEWLTGNMALSFLKTLRQGDFATSESWHWLPELMAALRFAWLREWFIRQNRELLCQELDFIWLLLDNRDLLRQRLLS